MQGIYCIENQINGKKYYGSSMNIEKRFHVHRTQLEQNRHHNVYLQRSYDKNGDVLDFYIVEQTDFDNIKDLHSLEQEYIDSNQGGYNIGQAGGGDLLTDNPNKDMIVEKMRSTIKQKYSSMSEEERTARFVRLGKDNPNWRNGGLSKKVCPSCNERYIDATSNVCGQCVDRSGENNPFFGKTHTEETIQKIREKNSGENSWIKNVDPKELPYTKTYEITYPDGTTKRVVGLKEIANEFGTSLANISSMIKRCEDGRYPQKGKFANHIVVTVQ